MTAKPIQLKPTEVADRLRAGRAVLVDIREADEFARRHVPGALSRPVSSFENGDLKIAPGQEVIFTCRSGMRTAANCERLGAAVEAQAYVLEGGIDGWAGAGLLVQENRRAPVEMIRQVQIGAGLLVLLGVALGFAISPGFFALSAFVGAGLTFAGLTGFCGMARLLALAPWNRRAA